MKFQIGKAKAEARIELLRKKGEHYKLVTSIEVIHKMQKT